MINIIAAVSLNGVIGNNGGIPWTAKQDLRRFKNLTTGHCVIMGRRTFESIGEPLRNRANIVVSRTLKDIRVTVKENLDEIIAWSVLSKESIWVIGGSEIYRRFLPFADNLYLTHVLKTYEGDTMFPAIDWLQWKVDDEPIMPVHNGQGPVIKFVKYRRRNNE